jgi:hypothetical protein
MVSTPILHTKELHKAFDSIRIHYKMGLIKTR